MAELDELVQQLLTLDEDELKTQLGMQVQGIGEDLKADTSLAALDVNTLMAVPRGPIADKALEVGQRLFNRVNAGAYDILCGNPFDDAGETLKQLEKALDESYAKAAGIVAPFLVTSLGLAPAIATIIATLIIQKIAKGSSQLICDTWKKSLEAT